MLPNHNRGLIAETDDQPTAWLFSRSAVPRKNLITMPANDPRSAEKRVDSEPAFGPWQLVILGLSLYVLGVLFIQTVFALPPQTHQLLEMTDSIICIVFIFDFFKNLICSENRLGYLKYGWIDLVSSIPMFNAFRVGRMFRLIRILRILRGIRSTKIIIAYVFRNRARGTLATVAMLSVTIMIFSAIAILNLENVPEANIKTAGDALWWAFVTITTVGYGDRFPVTHEGRILAGILMICGVGMFGTFTGCVASWFMPSAERQEDEIAALRAELREIKEMLKKKV